VCATCDERASSLPPTIEHVVEQLLAHCGEPRRSAPQAPIDELIATVLSQHTSDINTDRAFASLKRAFPRWDDVLDAPVSDIAGAIRSGGLADLKAMRIQSILRAIYEERGSFDLTFLADLSTEDALDWLTSLNGVGPKTAACVLLFSLDRPVIPVDTHVHRVSLRLGLIPPGTSAERAHGLVPRAKSGSDAYRIHMLLIQHGRTTCIARRPRCERCVLVQCCPSAAVYGAG
jgi:endonuclease-3